MTTEPTGAPPSPQPLVSVIMNCYNGEKYLREAVDSVIAQTYRNWEVIFWDNQSTDASASIARSYADSRIKYFYAPAHTLLSEARNLAASKARGEWLAFLDCDDFWLPNKLAAQIALADGGGRGVGLIYGRTDKILPNGDQSPIYLEYRNRPLPSGNIRRTLLEDGNMIAMSALMVRRSAFNEVGGIPITYEYSEDYYLIVAIASRYSALAVEELCCIYRVHASSMTAAGRERGFEESIRIVEYWSADDPALAKQKRAEFMTQIALDRILVKHELLAGTRLILTQGSVAFIVTRVSERCLRQIAALWSRVLGHA